MGNYRICGQLQSAWEENENLNTCKSRQSYKVELGTATRDGHDRRCPRTGRPQRAAPPAHDVQTHTPQGPRLMGRRACAAVTVEHRRGPHGHGGHRCAVRQGRPTLNTLIWQLAECKCSVYSPFSFCLNVSICTRKGTPFSPPCFRGVNSVLMQCTWKGKCGPVARRRVKPGPGLLKGPSPKVGFHPASSGAHLPQPPRSPTHTPLRAMGSPCPLYKGHALPPLSLDLGGPA